MSKKKRSRSGKRNATSSPRRPDEGAWGDLELAFFASAPPEVPGPAVEPESFDDLFAPTTSSPPMPAGMRRFLDAVTRLGVVLSAPRLSLRNVTIAVASLILLVGLSAVVFASHR